MRAINSFICCLFSLKSGEEVSTAVGNIEMAEAWWVCVCVATLRMHCRGRTHGGRRLAVSLAERRNKARSSREGIAEAMGVRMELKRAEDGVDVHVDGAWAAFLGLIEPMAAGRGNFAL
jgi:hypothetical protein